MVIPMRPFTSKTRLWHYKQNDGNKRKLVVFFLFSSKVNSSAYEFVPQDGITMYVKGKKAPAVAYSHTGAGFYLEVFDAYNILQWLC